VVYPCFYWLIDTKLKINKFTTVKYIGNVSVLHVSLILFSISVLVTWLFTNQKTTVFTNFIAICIAISGITLIQIPSFMIALILLGLFFFYDIFWVFISSFIFKQSVMESVALSLPSLPMLIYVPRLFLKGYSGLGLGDIVLPGLFICFLYRFDNSKKTKLQHGYFVVAIIGYVLALIIAYCMVITMERGQPALLYLVPCTMIPTAILAWRRKEFSEMWRKKPSPEKVPDEEQSILQSENEKEKDNENENENEVGKDNENEKKLNVK